MSNTPRTDAKERESQECSPKVRAYYGWRFARQLERENAMLRRALKPFAQFACSPPGTCDCHNCVARVAIQFTERG